MTAANCACGRVRDAAELLCRHALRQREQDVCFRPADAVGDQGDDVPVAPVFAQQVGGVPEPGDRLLGQGQSPQSGVERATDHRRADCRLSEQVGGASQPGCLGEVAEDAAQRDDAAVLARRERRIRRDEVPDARDVAGGLAGCEVVEDRVHDLAGARPSGAARPAK
jgi:hypothetical protein